MIQSLILVRNQDTITSLNTTFDRSCEKFLPIEGFREKIKREIQKHPKSRQRVFSAPTSNFQRNVEDYLKEMEIDMSFLEVMSYVKQSTKLLTYPKSLRLGAEK